MKSLLSTYTKAFVVEVDNVGSKQLQNTRIGLRGKAEVLMGKNTMMRKIFKEVRDLKCILVGAEKEHPPRDFLLLIAPLILQFEAENPDSPICKLGALCNGNIGFIFTNGDLGEVRAVCEENVRPAPAKVGGIAPSDVIVPKGPTGCDPGQTVFFQTLQIATKITKGQIEVRWQIVRGRSDDRWEGLAF